MCLSGRMALEEYSASSRTSLRICCGLDGAPVGQNSTRRTLPECAAPESCRYYHPLSQSPAPSSRKIYWLLFDRPGGTTRHSSRLLEQSIGRSWIRSSWKMSALALQPLLEVGTCSFREREWQESLDLLLRTKALRRKEHSARPAS